MKKIVFCIFAFIVLFLVGCEKDQLAEMAITGNHEVFIEESLEFGITIDGLDYQWQKNEIIWTVSNYEIATIENGRLTAKSCGEVVVGAVFREDSRFFATKTIAVVNPRVTDIEVSGPIEVEEDKRVYLEAIVVPSSIISGINWSSSDETILTVINGVVYGKKAGTASVIVECEGFEVFYPMTVLPLSTILEISGPEEIEVCEVIDLTSNVGDAIFVSSDEAIVKVVDHSICGVKEGVVTIYGYSEHNSVINGTIEITVRPYFNNIVATSQELEIVNEIVNSLTVSQLVGQMFIISCEAISSYSMGYYLDSTTGLPMYNSNNRTITAEQYLESTQFANFYINNSNTSSADFLTKIVTSYQKIAKEKTGINPFIYLEAGDDLNSFSTFTPALSNMALGASQRPSNAYEIGEIIGREMQTYGINGLLSSYLDLSTVGSEAVSVSLFSSNAKTNAIYADQLITGYNQNNINLIPKIAGDAIINNFASLYSLKNNELFLIRSAIKSGCNVLSIGDAYWPSLDSVQIAFSNTFINDYIRGDMNYNGVIMTDLSVFGYNNLGSINSYAVLEAINAGVDMISAQLIFNRYNSYGYINEMVISTYQDLINYVNNGTLPLSRVKEAVTRILLQKLRQGILDNKVSPQIPNYTDHLAVSQEISQESLTIVGNVPILDNSISTLVITQPYTLTNTSKTVNDFGSCFTAFFNQQTSYRNFKIKHTDIETESSLLAIAPSYDYIFITVVAMDTNPLVSERNEKTLYLDLIEKLYEVNPNVIAVVLKNPGDASYVSYLDNFIYAYDFYDTNFETIFRYLNGEFTNRAKLPF